CLGRANQMARMETAATPPTEAQTGKLDNRVASVVSVGLRETGWQAALGKTLVVKTFLFPTLIPMHTTTLPTEVLGVPEATGALVEMGAQAATAVVAGTELSAYVWLGTAELRVQGPTEAVVALVAMVLRVVRAEWAAPLSCRFLL